MTKLDKIDTALIAALRRNARISASDLATTLQITRATVRNRMSRLQADGTIAGYTLMLRADLSPAPVRGIMMLGVAGRGTDRLIRLLTGLPEANAVHTTNGKWDLIVELATDTLEDLDRTLAAIRKFDGVMTSETSLFLATHTPRT